MHKASSRKNRSNSALHSSIAKYGYKSFLVEELCTCFSKEELDFREQYFIDLHKSFVPTGYNLKTGGANGKHSQESKDKMSIIQQKLCEDDTHKQKVISYLKDHINSLTPEELSIQASKSSRDYWDKPGSKEAKSIKIASDWNTLPNQDKEDRISPMRDYWTEDKLKEHSGKIKSMELWKTSGCLDKAVEARRKPVKVVNIESKVETIYPSNQAVCKALRMTAATLIAILKGKRSNEYKGNRFITVN